MLTKAQEQLLEAHRTIDLRNRTSPLPFISGWEIHHNVTYPCLDGIGANPLR